jgi:hypothetical protein
VEDRELRRALLRPLVTAWLAELEYWQYGLPLLLLIEVEDRPGGAHWIAVKGDRFADSLLTGCEWKRHRTILFGWFLRSAYVVTEAGPWECHFLCAQNAPPARRKAAGAWGAR